SSTDTIFSFCDGFNSSHLTLISSFISVST
uniref:Uncharacterized protein n=1 Tax=Solanum lycopersicum TaxID=4081 RepID=A0A3Q7GW54_SOLLC